MFRNLRVDEAKLPGQAHVFRVTPYANDSAAFARCFEAQRERSADQADADDGYPVESGRSGCHSRCYSRRLAASAVRKRSFSPGVPIVTRRCSGSS